MAGLLLKNTLRLRLAEVPPDVVEFVKRNIFNSIGDPVQMIRGTVSTVIDTLVVELGPAAWPEALSRLMELVDSPDQSTQEVSRVAFSSSCRDELQGDDPEPRRDKGQSCCRGICS